MTPDRDERYRFQVDWLKRRVEVYRDAAITQTAALLALTGDDFHAELLPDPEDREAARGRAQVLRERMRSGKR